MKWRPRPRILKRLSDQTLWTPAGDTPYPLWGFNFARLHKARIGWWVDMSDRWVFRDWRAFEVVR